MSYAKQYEENKRESKPSRFLEEIKFDKNPLIQVTEYEFDDTESSSILVEENKIEYLKSNLQIKAMRSISQMNLRTAIDTIADLAKIKYYQEKSTLEGFDAKEYCKIDYISNILDNELKNARIPLIDKEELKLSASKIWTLTTIVP